MEHASLLKGLETCAISKSSNVESHPRRHVQKQWFASCRGIFQIGGIGDQEHLPD